MPGTVLSDLYVLSHYSLKLSLSHFIKGQTEAERSHVSPKITKAAGSRPGFKPRPSLAALLPAFLSTFWIKTSGLRYCVSDAHKLTVQTSQGLCLLRVLFRYWWKMRLDAATWW